MQDDTSVAFDAPIARARATAGADPLDRISVRDYVRAVEIGAFQSERGVTQRVRFNVVLEVGHSTAAQDDDVDKVISYDTIVDAIEAQLSTERINLLETLADRVAERVLDDPRAIRCFVRIEKLDRIPGALGVEIMRRRVETGDGVVRAMEAQPIATPEMAAPMVIFVPNAVLYAPNLPAWLDAIDALERPAILTVEMGSVDLIEDHAMCRRRVGLLAMEQNAWRLAARDDRCVVVESRTELEHAASTHQLSVWAPSKIVLDAVHRPKADGETPLALARWFAEEIGAGSVVLLGVEGPDDGSGVPVHSLAADNPDAIAAL